MNRFAFTRALLSSIEGAGYSSIVAPQSQLMGGEVSLPTVWVEPLDIVEIDGRKSGKVHYSLTLGMLCDSGNNTLSDRSFQASEMEGEIFNILSQLSLYDCVIAIEDITTSVAKQPLTRFSEVAVVAKARVVTHFE